MEQHQSQPDDDFAWPAHLQPFDAPPPRARVSDPVTSKAAAARAKWFAPSHAELILGVLWRPMTPVDISKLTGLSVVQIDRRRIEMVRDGSVKLGAERDGFQLWERVL